MLSIRLHPRTSLLSNRPSTSNDPSGSLREYAERQPEGRIRADDAIRYLRGAALALSDAARMGMVHRDVKPDNFLLDENDTLKVTDFGISKFAQQDACLSLTMGGIIGTPMYMSPEQCRGEELDFRSDMWSLGATFFFLLTGEPPAKGSSLLELIRTKNEVRNLDPSKILPYASPGPLSEVIRRLTMLDREERFRTYDELLTDLEAVAAGRAVVRRSQSGLFYNHFRDYDPHTGRYIESDPIGLAGGINTYSYVGGNPVSKVDPDGLAQICFKPGSWSGGRGWPHFKVCNGNDCVGFGPDGPDWKDFVFGPGSADPEPRSEKDQCADVPSCNDEAMNKCVLECERKNTFYNVLFRNCFDFAVTCAVKCAARTCKKRLTELLD